MCTKTDPFINGRRLLHVDLQSQRTACLQFIANPILEHVFEEKSPDSMKILDSGMIELILRHLFDIREEVRQEYSEATRIELLKLSTLLLKNIPEELKDYRRELLNFGWKHTKREEDMSRQWALVNVCQFIESFQVSQYFKYNALSDYVYINWQRKGE